LPTPLTTFSNFVISSYFFFISNKILKDEILKVWKMVIVNIDVRESRFKIMSYLPDQRQWES
jgi:5'-3' exonuclease